MADRDEIIQVINEIGAAVDGEGEVTEIQSADQIGDYNVTLPGIRRDGQGNFMGYVVANMSLFMGFLQSGLTTIQNAWSAWFGTNDQTGVQGQWKILRTNVQTATAAANTAAEDAETATEAADAATEAAEAATDGAENVDATVNGYVITVTDRDGDTHQINLKPDIDAKLDKISEEDFDEIFDSEATEAYKGSYNLVTDLNLTLSATRAQIATALGTAISGEEDGDYAYVMIPFDASRPVYIEHVERYSYNGTAWAFDYVYNRNILDATGDGIFDISAYHAEGGALVRYADLEAALGTNGANIPESERRGGMTVRFVSGVTGEYEQWRLLSDTFNTTVSNWQGVDRLPKKDSRNLLESGAAFEAARLDVPFNPSTYVNQLGEVKTTSAEMFKTTPFVPAVEGIILHGVQRATTGGYNVVLCFYDENKKFISYLSADDNSDLVLTSENIANGAKYFIANLNTAKGAIYSKYRIDYSPYIEDVKNDILDIEKALFCFEYAATRKTGLLAYTSSIKEDSTYRSTPYIDINDIKDFTNVRCLFSSDNGIQCFNSDMEFLGIYNDFTDVENATLISFNFDKSKVPNNTAYVRMSGTKNCYIHGVSWESKYDITDNEYLDYSESKHGVLCKMCKKIHFSENYYDYDNVILASIPSYSEFADIEHNKDKCFDFRFYKDEQFVKHVYFYLKDGAVDGDTIYFNDGKSIFEFDFSMRPGSRTRTAGIGKCKIKAFAESYYKDLGGDYVITETPALENYAAAFTYFKYVAESVLDVTCQRFPAIEDALAEGSDEYFVFYIWENGVKKRSVRCYIRDASVDDGVVTYVSDMISFTVNFNIAGSVSKKASVDRLDLVLSQKCFELIDTEDKHIRTDIINKKYANISSSTFSSYKWHQQCIEDLGMEYTNFGMGGASHRPYNGARFNLNYQDKNQPTADRNVLNMVAKICTENVENGYYPDIIGSCCVLNDCGSNVTLDKIGTAEEAIAATLPSLDISSAANIESTFSAFFESTDPDIVAFRGNSMKMMRLSFELLSQKFPYTQIIICSCQQVTSTSFNQAAITQFNEEQRKLAKHLAIPYIDINGECGINKITADTFLKEDKLHPNDAGELVYKKFMRERLNCLITLKR